MWDAYKDWCLKQIREEEVSKTLSASKYGTCKRCGKILTAAGIHTCTPGLKHDGDKLDWTLLPFEPLESVVKVLTFGANKYNVDNWKFVEPKERYLKSAFRHLIQYKNGEYTDDESGQSHLAHAICSLLFLLYKEEISANIT